MKAQVLEIKPWKKDFCVALVAGTESEDKGAFAVALFAAGDASLPARMKATTGPISLEADESATNLDLAKYDVTATQTAIGVRIRRRRGYAGGGEATLDRLVLYLARGKDLEPILKASMSYEANLAGDWAEDGTRGRVSESDTATLVVSKKRTHGHFDLVRKTSSGTQHLRWEGDGYVEADEDPFAKVQLDIFD